MKLSDPATAITDYILCAESLVFASMLFVNSGSQRSIFTWALAFMMLAFGSLSGGIYHHGRQDFADTARRRLGKATALGLFAALILFVSAGVFAGISGPARAYSFILLALISFFGVFLVTRPGKGEISVNTLPILWGVLLVLSLLLLRHWFSNGPRSGIYILAGSIVCCAGVLVQQAAPRFHRHFNHNDVCHLFFMAGLYFLYCGGLLLKDRL